LIITLLSHEKNIGVLALTDYILEKLGKDNCAVVGSNYLVEDKSYLIALVENYSSQNKNVIIKYVVPKEKFSNQDINFPKNIEEKSDLILRVPKFVEELKRPLEVKVYKGQGNPFLSTINEYYK
jgi:hypothetical protein